MNTNGPLNLDIKNPKVTLQQTTVYRNGRQQARIRIDLESTRGGVPSDLTPTEIEGIRLFDYHNRASGLIPFSDDGSLNYKGWSAQHVFRGYVPQPGTTLEPRAVQSYFFYLSANADAVEALDIAFQISGDDGSIFWTNGRKSVGGTEQPWPNGDNSVGITVTPLPPVKYPSNAFVLDRHPIHLKDVAPGIFTDMVTVSIVLTDGTTLGIRQMKCVPAGLIHWKGPQPSSNPCFTGYVRPSETAIQWHTDIENHWGAVTPPAALAAPQDERGVVVLVGRLDIPSWTGAPKEPVKVVMTDAHGSDQTCSISFKDETRDELIVT